MNLGSIFKKESQRVRAGEPMRGAESVSKSERLMRLQNEVRGLKPGQTLQGTVVGRNGNSVQIELAQDFAINAKLDQSVSLALGQMMSFEVKANTGAFMSLAPLYTNTANTATILRALAAAGLPETSANIEMVAKMMEEGMPIDKDSVLNMSRLLLDFPGKDPATLIQMTRLELPITEANIEQFEQYLNANHQILGSAETIADELPRAFMELLSEGQGEKALALYEAVIDIFTEDEAEGDGTVIRHGTETETARPGETSEKPPLQETGDARNTTDGADVKNAAQGGQAENTQNAAALGKALQAALTQETLEQEAAGKGQQPNVQEGAQAQAETQKPSVLTRGQWEKLSDELRRLGVDEQTAQQVKSGEMPAKDVLRLVRQLLSGAGEKPVPGQEQALHRLLAGKEFQTLLKDQVDRQWTIEPKDVADKKQVEQLYERIREQTARLSQALEAAGKGDAPVARSVQNLQSNVDFMNQMNHLYTYVQLPLKMLGNNAHGDLYVYTNKKNLAARDGQVSALLHLDMEHLGPLDVYVTMKDKQVATNFTVMDDSILELIEQNIDILNKRLTDRGYSLKAQMHVREEEEEEGETSIMQTILHQQKNISVLSRTSFDMRA